MRPASGWPWSSLEVGRPWHLAWWDYHAFLLAGFAAAIYAVVTGYRRSSTLHRRRHRRTGPVAARRLTVIRQHHERYDGRGYPEGLAGEEISLAARVVAVADVWDALTLGPRLPAGRPHDPVPAEESCHPHPPAAKAFPGR